MDRPSLMLIVLAVLAVLLLLMVLGWRARQRRQRGLAAPLTLPTAPGEPLFTAELFYVATTTAGEPLDRIAVRGLGYRARAGLTVYAAGLGLAIPGQAALFIPAADIRGVDRATWTIDRVVESDGLVLIGWTVGAASGDAAAAASPGTALDSYFRLDSAPAAAGLITAVARLLPSTTPSPTTADHTTATTTPGGIA